MVKNICYELTFIVWI